MPVHDWYKVESAYFHAFHHEWISEIHRSLNAGLLPEDYYAVPEQHSGGYEADVLGLRRRGSDPAGGTATRPATRYTYRKPGAFYRGKKSVVTVRHVSGDHVVAVIEIVSPGNKESRNPFRSFVEKALDLIEQRVHLLIVDVLPPTKRDPNGVHAAIWEHIDETQPFAPPPGQPLTLVAYEAGAETVAYVEPVGVGDPLPDMPLFLESGEYVNVPLERTYQSAWAVLPPRLRELITAPREQA